MSRRKSHNVRSTADVFAIDASGPLRRTSVSDEIASRLVGSILAGTLRFGDKLPAERDLAEYFNVGRPSVREALRTLSVVGLIEVRHGEGAFVVDRHADFVAKAFSWVILLDPATTQEIIEARIAIEGSLARLAAERCSERDLADLAQRLGEMEAAVDGSDLDVERFSQADLAFHLTIAEASRNMALSRTLTAIRSLLESWIKRALATKETAELAVAQHRAILAALHDGNPAAAELAMREHLEAMAARIPMMHGSRESVGGREVPLSALEGNG
jgi:GntR family transcriptional regulator, transcriptional repressor for pyruvate dehydrogenase complex